MAVPSRASALKLPDNTATKGSLYVSALPPTHTRDACLLSVLPRQCLLTTAHFTHRSSTLICSSVLFCRREYCALRVLHQTGLLCSANRGALGRPGPPGPPGLRGKEKERGRPAPGESAPSQAVPKDGRSSSGASGGSQPAPKDGRPSTAGSTGSQPGGKGGRGSEDGTSKSGRRKKGGQQAVQPLPPKAPAPSHSGGGRDAPAPSPSGGGWDAPASAADVASSIDSWDAPAPPVDRPRARPIPAATSGIAPSSRLFQRSVAELPGGPTGVRRGRPEKMSSLPEELFAAEPPPEPPQVSWDLAPPGITAHPSSREGENGGPLPYFVQPPPQSVDPGIMSQPRWSEDEGSLPRLVDPAIMLRRGWSEEEASLPSRPVQHWPGAESTFPPHPVQQWPGSGDLDIAPPREGWPHSSEGNDGPLHPMQPGPAFADPGMMDPSGRPWSAPYDAVAPPPRSAPGFPGHVSGWPNDPGLPQPAGPHALHASLPPQIGACPWVDRGERGV